MLTDYGDGPIEIIMSVNGVNMANANRCISRHGRLAKIVKGLVDEQPEK